MRVEDIKRRVMDLRIRGKLREAIKEIETYFNQGGKEDPGLYNLLGDLYVVVRDHKKAYDAYKKSAELYKKLEFYSNVIPVLKKILKIAPFEYDVLKDIAEAYIQMGLEGDAIKIYFEYLKKLVEDKREEEFEGILSDFEKLASKNIRLQLNLAEFLSFLKRFDKAVKYFVNVLKYAIENQNEDLKNKVFSHIEKIVPIDYKIKILESVVRSFEMEKILGLKLALADNYAELNEYRKAKQIYLQIYDYLIKKGKEREAEEVKLRMTDKIPVEILEELEKEVEVKQEVVSFEEKEKEFEIVERKTEEILWIPQKIEDEINSCIKVSIELPAEPEEGWIKFVEEGNKYLDLDDKDNALKNFKIAVVGYLLSGDYEKAEKLLLQIPQFVPFDEDLIRLKVKVYLIKRDKENLINSLLELAKFYENRGKYEDSLKIYELVLKIDRENYTARQGLARLRQKREEEMGVWVDLKNELVKEIEKPSFQERVKSISLEEEIIEGFKEAAAESVAEVEDVNTLYELALSFYEMGLYNEAIEKFEKLINSEKKLKAFEGLARSYAELGNYDKALECIEKALNLEEIDETNELAFRYLRAEIYEKLGKKEEALKEYRYLYEHGIKEVASKIERLE